MRYSIHSSGTKTKALKDTKYYTCAICGCLALEPTDVSRIPLFD